MTLTFRQVLLLSLLSVLAALALTALLSWGLIGSPPSEPQRAPTEEQPAPPEPVPKETMIREAVEETPEELPELPPSAEEAEAPAAPPGPASQRFPVVGRPGHWLVLEPDGTAWLEKESGQKEKLALAAEAPDEPADVTAKYRRRTPPQDVQPRAGRLVVLTKGVVEIGDDEIITLQDETHVVTRNALGQTFAYYADGRVERRERPLRSGVLTP